MALQAINEIKKAETIAKKIGGKMCIADDSGIEIEFLDGFPGVVTKRWHSGTDRERNLSIIGKLKGVPKEKRKITFTTKAEDKCLSVACGSLISRYVFIKEMNKISKELGVIIPKGAGVTVDKVGKEIVKKHGKDILNKYAKLNFKNTEKILEED